MYGDAMLKQITESIKIRQDGMELYNITAGGNSEVIILMVVILSGCVRLHARA